MEKVCGLCASKQVRYTSRIKKYKLFQCENCRIVFLSPQPRTTYMRLYTLQKYDSLQVKKAYFKMREELFRRARKCIEVLKCYKKAGQLLDIGCSYGFYLKQFNNYGYTATGIDLSKQAITYVKNKLNLKAIVGNFENYPFTAKSFDIITLFDVLEHFSNPNKIITKIGRILRNDGILIVQTPNYNSLISKIAGLKWFWLLIPNHLFLYSVNTLRFFLTKNKFKILKINTWDDFEEFTRNILYLLRIRDDGKTKFLYKILSKMMLFFLPISLFWNNYFLGGEILIYARKEK